ncbi:MAG TPA: 6-phospho-3-hexuloisomerase [Candidatus Methanomethylia archaeon]|nr:6-phospho-3-hexuloisomerase [Candidatus Methanomethylicia archaeon]
MASVKRIMSELAAYVAAIADALDNKQVDQVIDLLVKAHEQKAKILVIGAGRSGLVARAFAMRLMHLDFNVYVVGETITPAIGPNDILIAISGSGSTRLVVTAAQIAKEIGAIIVAITSYRDSPLGKLADYLVIIPGRTKIARRDDYLARQIIGEHEPLAPLGTLFEVSSMVFLDSVISELMARLGYTEEKMKAKHATIE